MKIVFVSDAIYPYLHGGKEKRLYEISTRLAKAGNDVHVYTMHWWMSPENTRIEDGVTLHALCKYYEMYGNGRRTTKEGLIFGLACFKLFSVKFDVLDVDHMPFFPVLSSWIVCLFTFRLRNFFGTWHEVLSRAEWIEYMGPTGNIAALIERITIQLPHSITASSERTQQLLLAQRGMRNKIEVVTPGIDQQAIKEIEPAPIVCNVLAVCRLVKGKNIDVLINAINLLVKKNPKITSIIVGKGPEKNRLMLQVRKLGIDKNIKFIERLAFANDVYAYMKAADVFCLPTNREGFGIVTLESLGCGTPVVTLNSSSNASRHFIRDGKNGSIVPLDPQAIADAIEYWLSSGHSKQGIAKNVASYNWDILTQKQSEVYI